MSKTLKCVFLALLLPLTTASGYDIPAPHAGKDDSDVIIGRLQESMGSNGLISVEQHTGRLLFNPLIDKLRNMPLKQKFLLPAMIVNQKEGMKLVEEIPFTCFMISGTELTGEHYKGFKQHETARYLRDVKSHNIDRVLLCQAVGLSGARSWGKNLALTIDNDKFVFDEHTSLSGERFYYFLNSDGLFEMYL